jgi:hypothetical protein
MFLELERRVSELRFIDGIEKVEHVPYSAGDQFWVRFNLPLDMQRLQDIVKMRGYELFKFGSLPSKLPRKLSEVLWDGITHVIVKNISGWERFTTSLGLEPEGIVKIAVDLHGPHEIIIATNEDGIQLLYDYLGVKYVPPAKPVTATVKPSTPAAKPVTVQTTTPASSQPPPPTTPVAKPTPTATQLPAQDDKTPNS